MLRTEIKEKEEVGVGRRAILPMCSDDCLIWVMMFRKAYPRLPLTQESYRRRESSNQTLVKCSSWERMMVTLIRIVVIRSTTLTTFDID